MNITEKIANAILTNYNSNSNLNGSVGLYHGNAGVSLALYYLNRDLKKQSLEDSAGSLIDDLYSKISKNVMPNFEFGLAGIAWVIDHLARNGFCNGDANDILRDVDAFIFRYINGSEKIPLNLSNGLIGYLIYAISRVENVQEREHAVLLEINKSLFRNIIDKIDNLMPSAFPTLSKDLGFTISWYFPILLVFLKKALELNIYNDKIKNMINGWMFYFNTLMPANQLNRIYWVVGLSYLNQYLCSAEIKKQIEVLMYSIDFESLKSEITPGIVNINEGWFSVVVIMKKAEELLNSDCPNYSHIYDTRMDILKEYFASFEDYLQNDVNQIDISLIRGLSGIALLFSLFPEAFEITC